MTRYVVIALLLTLLPAAIASRRVEEGLRRVVSGAFALSAGAALLLLVVQLGVVILRSVFSVSFIWLQESTLYLFGLMFLLSSGALLLDEGHVRVDIFYTKLSERRKGIVDLFGMLVFVVPLAILIIAVSWNYVATSWAQLERSQEPTGIHAVFLLKTMIPAFAMLLLFAAAVRIAGLVRVLRGRE